MLSTEHTPFNSAVHSSCALLTRTNWTRAYKYPWHSRSNSDLGLNSYVNIVVLVLNDRVIFLVRCATIITKTVKTEKVCPAWLHRTKGEKSICYKLECTCSLVNCRCINISSSLDEKLGPRKLNDFQVGCGDILECKYIYFNSKSSQQGLERRLSG